VHGSASPELPKPEQIRISEAAQIRGVHLSVSAEYAEVIIDLSGIEICNEATRQVRRQALSFPMDDVKVILEANGSTWQLISVQEMGHHASSFLLGAKAPQNDVAAVRHQPSLGFGISMNCVRFATRPRPLE
jgi:hypothetical protein